MTANASGPGPPGRAQPQRGRAARAVLRRPAAVDWPADAARAGAGRQRVGRTAASTPWSAAFPAVRVIRSPHQRRVPRQQPGAAATSAGVRYVGPGQQRRVRRPGLGAGHGRRPRRRPRPRRGHRPAGVRAALRRPGGSTTRDQLPAVGATTATLGVQVQRPAGRRARTGGGAPRWSTGPGDREPDGRRGRGLLDLGPGHRPGAGRPGRPSGDSVDAGRPGWRRGRLVVEVRLEAPEPPARSRSTAGAARRTVEVGHRPRPGSRCRCGGSRYDVINNVGAVVFADGYGADRGCLEVDTGQFDEPAEVFAWCGGGVLLRPSYLDRGRPVRRALLPLLRGHRPLVAGPGAGLALPLRARGPSSATCTRPARGVGSEMFCYYIERNRLLMLVRNAPAAMACDGGVALRRGHRLVRVA